MLDCNLQVREILSTKVPALILFNTPLRLSMRRCGRTWHGLGSMPSARGLDLFPKGRVHRFRADGWTLRGPTVCNRCGGHVGGQRGLALTVVYRSPACGTVVLCVLIGLYRRLPLSASKFHASASFGRVMLSHHLSGGINPYEGVLSEGSHIDGGCCKNWCARQCSSAF